MTRRSPRKRVIKSDSESDDRELESEIFVLKGSKTSAIFSILNLERVLDKEKNQWNLVDSGTSEAEAELKSQILANGGKVYDLFDPELSEKEGFVITLVISSGDSAFDSYQAKEYLNTKARGNGEETFRDLFEARYIRHCLISGRLRDLNKYRCRFMTSVFYQYKPNDILTQKIKWSNLQRKPPPLTTEQLQLLQQQQRQKYKHLGPSTSISHHHILKDNVVGHNGTNNGNDKIISTSTPTPTPRRSPRKHQNGHDGISTDSSPTRTRTGTRVSQKNTPQNKSQTNGIDIGKSQENDIPNGNNDHDANGHNDHHSTPTPTSTGPSPKTVRFEETANVMPMAKPKPKEKTAEVAPQRRRLKFVRSPSPGQNPNEPDMRPPPMPPSGRLSEAESFQIPYGWRSDSQPGPSTRSRSDGVPIVPAKIPRTEPTLAPPVSPISSDSEMEEIQIESDDEQEQTSSSMASSRAVAARRTTAERLMTKSEMQTVLNYVCEKKLHDRVKGNVIWKALAKKNVIKDRTFHALRNNFLRSILPRGKLETFQLSANDLKIFRRIRGDPGP